MGGRPSREKGKRGERELAVALSTLLGQDWRRGQQFSGERGNADVVGVPGLHVECKRVEKLDLKSAMRQSRSDAPDGRVPVVCHRASHEPWLITLDLRDLPRLSRQIVELISEGCDGL